MRCSQCIRCNPGLGGLGNLCFSLLEGVQGQWAWSQMGVHDVRVTVLDLPLVSGVQGEGGMGALHCPTCMGAPPVMLPWFYVVKD